MFVLMSVRAVVFIMGATHQMANEHLKCGSSMPRGAVE